MLLQVNDIHCGYGKIEVLKGISVKISEKEIIGIIGANGAGKTTLLRAISGFVPLTKGQVYFMEKEISRLKPDQIVKMGICQVPEGRQLFPRMEVLENIELGAYLRNDMDGIRKDINDWIFNLFPVLGERMHQLAGTLSGGEQQMVAVARGLMSRPKLLMLDEPSFGLAPLVTETLFGTIKKIAEEGLTTLLVEQNSTATLDISSRTYVLETGEIALEGKSNDLINNPHVKEIYLGL